MTLKEQTMSTDKIDQSKTEATLSSGELTDEQLNAVTGGGKTTAQEKPREFIKITMSDIIVSNY